MSPSFDPPQELTELEQLSIRDWEGESRSDGVGERELVRQMIDPATPTPRLLELARLRAKATGFRLHVHVPTLMAFYLTEIHRLSEQIGGLYSIETVQAFLTDAQSEDGLVLGAYLLLMNPSLPIEALKNIVFGALRPKMLFLKYNPAAMFQVTDEKDSEFWRIFFYDLLLENQRFDDFTALFLSEHTGHPIQFSQAQAIAFFREHIKPSSLLNFGGVSDKEPRSKVPLLYEEDDPAIQLAIVADLFPRIRKAPENAIYHVYYALRLMVQGKPVPQDLLASVLRQQFPPSADDAPPPMDYLASILRAAASLHGMVGWPTIPQWFLEATGFADAIEIVPPPPLLARRPLRKASSPRKTRLWAGHSQRKTTSRP